MVEIQNGQGQWYTLRQLISTRENSLLFEMANEILDGKLSRTILRTKICYSNRIGETRH